MKKKKRVYKAREGFTLSEAARVNIKEPRTLAATRMIQLLLMSLAKEYYKKEGK